MIPGSGRSAGEGIGYRLQYSWSSFVTQLMKNPPAMRETWVLSLGWKDLLEKGKATHSHILAWRIHGLYTSWGHKELDVTNFQVNTGYSVEMILEGVRDTSESYCNYPGKKEMMVCELGHLC